MARLFLVFAVVPLLDLWVLLRIGAAVGPWGTLALIVLPSLLGAWLARREGLRVLRCLAAGDDGRPCSRWDEGFRGPRAMIALSPLA